MIPSLDETLARCTRGCPDAWRRLFEAHAPVVYHVVRDTGAPHEAAEDVVGDVFLQLIENRAACLSRAHFATEQQFRRWLIVLAKNRYIDISRHNLAVRAVPVDEGVEWEIADSLGPPDAEEEILRGIDARSEAERAMAHVSPRERFIIRLFYAEEMRLKEIAILTGSPVGAISAIISRARNKIRRRVQQNEPLDRSVDGRTALEHAPGLAIAD